MNLGRGDGPDPGGAKGPFRDEGFPQGVGVKRFQGEEASFAGAGVGSVQTFPGHSGQPGFSPDTAGGSVSDLDLGFAPEGMLIPDGEAHHGFQAGPFPGIPAEKPQGSPFQGPPGQAEHHAPASNLAGAGDVKGLVHQGRRGRSRASGLEEKADREGASRTTSGRVGRGVQDHVAARLEGAKIAFGQDGALVGLPFENVLLDQGGLLIREGEGATRKGEGLAKGDHMEPLILGGDALEGQGWKGRSVLKIHQAPMDEEPIPEWVERGDEWFPSA